MTAKEKASNGWDKVKGFMPLIVIAITVIGGMYTQSIRSDEQYKNIKESIENVKSGNTSLGQKVDKLRQDMNDKFIRKDEFNKESNRNDEAHRTLWQKINQFRGSGE